MSIKKKKIFESFLTSLPTSGKVAFLMSHLNSPNFIFVCEADLYVLMLSVSQSVSHTCSKSN